MKRKTVASWSGALTAGLAVFIGGYFSTQGLSGTRSAIAAANAVSFPALDNLVHYTTVRRGVTREHMLTTPEALSAIKAGQPVAVGTHVVLVDYQSDVLHRYLVAQKVGEGSSEWAYQWFWPDQSIKADENVAQCYSCHRSREEEQFMFTFTDATAFK
ncbi:hypothetical protein [Rhizobium sp. LjRoot258]|uniref:hypothetical protein n=1 Tax=Rhizobium sp. LjRoot258 TaxID=3342299 RepID=UPI003ECEB245